MGAFLENSLFFLVDDAEPILPIYRAPEHRDSGRIVELADVGCDTETNFSRGMFDRRRGGAESFGSRVAKHDRKPRNLSTRAAAVFDNFAGRKENYAGRKAHHNNRDYDHMYVSDLDYDSCVKDPYGDFEFSKNRSSAEHKDSYYTDYITPRNIIGCPRKECLLRDVRYNRPRNLESLFSHSNRGYHKKDLRWFIDNNERNVQHDARDADIRARQSQSSSKRGKTTNIFSRMDERFNQEADLIPTELEEDCVAPQSWAREDIFSKDPDFWDFVPPKNEPSHEEVTFSTRMKNRGPRQRMTLRGISCNSELSQSREMEIISDPKKKDPGETREEDNREDSSVKSPIKSAEYQNAKNNAMTRKPLRSNLLNSSARVRSAKISIDAQLSSVRSEKEKAATNVRPHSAINIEHRTRNIEPPTSSEKKKETVNFAFARTKTKDQHSFKFSDTSTKISNEAPDQSLKISNRIADLKSNGVRTYAMNEKDDFNSHIATPRINKIRRTDSISRSASRDVTENERASLGGSVPRTIAPVSVCKAAGKENGNRSSRLPVRTWKRRKTKEPAALRSESNKTKLELRGTDDSLEARGQLGKNRTVSSSDRLKRTEDNEASERIAEDRSNVKRNISGKLKVFRHWGNLKEIKKSNMTKGRRDQGKRE